MMISFFAETAVIGRLAAKRRQRWRKVRTSAQDRRFRLVAISIWTAHQFITRSSGRLLSQAIDRMALFIFASDEASIQCLVSTQICHSPVSSELKLDIGADVNARRLRRDRKARA